MDRETERWGSEVPAVARLHPSEAPLWPAFAAASRGHRPAAGPGPEAPPPGRSRSAEGLCPRPPAGQRSPGRAGSDESGRFAVAPRTIEPGSGPSRGHRGGGDPKRVAFKRTTDRPASAGRSRHSPAPWAVVCPRGRQGEVEDPADVSRPRISIRGPGRSIPVPVARDARRRDGWRGGRVEYPRCRMDRADCRCGRHGHYLGASRSAAAFASAASSVAIDWSSLSRDSRSDRSWVR